MDAKSSLPLKTLLGQFLLYALFAGVLGVFSRWPVYRPIAADQAVIKLSFSHHGKPIADCRIASAQELAKLAPNMRAPQRCPRERSPVVVELDVDGALVYHGSAMPSGLSKDGASAMYQRLMVAAGSHRIAVRLNDDARKPGFSYVREAAITLMPAQILVIDFDADKGGVTLR